MKDPIFDFNLKISIRIPSVPNFLILETRPNQTEEMSKISIAALTDGELDQIAEMWKVELKRRAKEIRETPVMR